MYTPLQSPMFVRRQSSEAAPACAQGAVDLSNMPLRIGSIFIILAGSLIGAIAPILLARTTSMHVPKMTFFVFKYVGAGVIIGTAWMHLLADGATALADPCLVPILGTYQWAFAIALLTILLMFFIEMMASNFGDHQHVDCHTHGNLSPAAERQEKPDAAAAAIDSTATTSERSVPWDDCASRLASPCPHESSRGVKRGLSNTCFSGPDSTRIPGLPDDVSYPPGGQNHLGHGLHHLEGDSHESVSGQLTAILILEFGVVFHSIFIGLALATSSDLIVLLVVLLFHQCFEGLGLGSRLAIHPWPGRRRWIPYALAILYAISTPLSIAVGLVAHSPNPQTQLLVGGIFDSISAGILMYTGLVELLAHEFMFSPEMRQAPLRMQTFAFGCVAAGAGIMAALANWA